MFLGYTKSTGPPQPNSTWVPQGLLHFRSWAEEALCQAEGLTIPPISRGLHLPPCPSSTLVHLMDVSYASAQDTEVQQQFTPAGLGLLTGPSSGEGQTTSVPRGEGGGWHLCTVRLSISLRHPQGSFRPPQKRLHVPTTPRSPLRRSCGRF